MSDWWRLARGGQMTARTDEQKAAYVAGADAALASGPTSRIVRRGLQF
jgi:hypothetical protein